MTTLKSNIVDQILYFVQELHKNHNTTGDFMHTVIYGPPGTGKTEIAKMMGKIYSKIGILKNGTFKKVTRSDLIAGYLGQTALKTRDVIKDALGGVLFIDEAYALGNSEKRDSFSKECIDTLCEALSDNKENLMVIIAGYEKELKECFFDYNQGLDSRFTWRFKTDEYNAEDLYKIFVKKVKDIGWELDENSKITVDWFKKNIEYFKFFGRDIETILAKTKIAHSKRVFCKPENEKKKINIKDLDKGLEIYLKNENIKNRKEEEYLKKQLYNTLYC
jgi:SpoVK/Ycf46/Vps4 family AAA+-type ATPase